MTNRQRQQSTGRSNISSSTSTVLDSAPVRPLRLRLIPEEATDRTVATVRTDGLELPASSSRLGPRAVEQDRNTFDAYSCRPWAAPSVQVNCNTDQLFAIAAPYPSLHCIFGFPSTESGSAARKG